MEYFGAKYAISYKPPKIKKIAIWNSIRQLRSRLSGIKDNSVRPLIEKELRESTVLHRSLCKILKYLKEKHA